MGYSYYAIVTGMCFCIVLAQSIVVVWACNRGKDAMQRADVLQRTVSQQNERIDALVADALAAMYGRDDTIATINSMPVLSGTEVLARVTREINLN